MSANDASTHLQPARLPLWFGARCRFADVGRLLRWRVGRALDGGSGSGSGPASTAKGSETKALSAPSSFKEAPSLTKLVEAGELPEVGKRLPASPYVIPHRWVASGKYGGHLRMIMKESYGSAIKEYMYGRSFLRFLNDGLDIGPGLVESWESNDDATEWVFHFRRGLKWSDGEPWTTADIMYWWDDMVNNDDYTGIDPPDDVRSGKGTVAKVAAPDDLTLTLTFDAPAPITPERLAAWVNSPVREGSLGPLWMQPKHYMSQFHPTYNKKVTKKEWYLDHDIKGDFGRNVDCPTLTGWKLKSYKEGRSVVFERNPYYWCIDREGKQLPYIDEVQFSVVVDDEVQKLQMSEGKVDYVHGGHHGLVLEDISGFKQNEDRTGVRVLLWDSGSGTGSIVFFNYDYPRAGDAGADPEQGVPAGTLVRDQPRGHPQVDLLRHR